MARVNFVTILASLAVLNVGEHVMFQRALFRHQNRIFSIGNFSRDANCQLVVESIVSFLAEGPVVFHHYSPWVNIQISKRNSNRDCSDAIFVNV